MTNTSQTAQEIIAELFLLAMTQQSHELDVFVDVAGHVKTVSIRVVTNCTYKDGEPFNIVLNVTIHQKSDIFTQELRTALSDVLALISQHKMKGAA